MKLVSSACWLFLVLMPASTWSQDPDISWERSTDPTGGVIETFHSPHVVNLETAETISKNIMEFQIYHRFLPTFSDGYDFFWGLDGPVNIRLGLGYGVTDRFSVTLARSNVLGNVDLKAKYRFFETLVGDFPVMAAVQAAGAWNTNVSGRDATDDRNFQYYAEAILNTAYRGKFSVGVAPAYLYNGSIFDPYRDSFILGLYGQYYFLGKFSLLVEWTGVVDGYQQDNNNLTWGLEIRTAGHFFKIVATNGTSLNPSRYLTGASESAAPDNWHLGFNITRLLAF